MSIRISNLLNWNNRTARAMNSTPFWMKLVRTFGTELLYFLIDKEHANQIPESTAALKKFKTQIIEWNGRKPKHGSVWILFAFKEILRIYQLRSAKTVFCCPLNGEPERMLRSTALSYRKA